MPPYVSSEVKNAITRSMQPRKKDRPQNVQSFLELLPGETVMVDDEETIVPEKGTTVPPAPRFGKIWMIASALLLCVALLLGASLLKQKKAGGADLSKEVEMLTSSNESLQKQVDDLQSKEKSLTQSNNSMRKQVDDLKGQVSSQNSKITSLQNENASLKKQVNEYKPKAERWDRSMNSK